MSMAMWGGAVAAAAAAAAAAFEPSLEEEAAIGTMESTAGTMLPPASTVVGRSSEREYGSKQLVGDARMVAARARMHTSYRRAVSSVRVRH
ncbi:Os07g0192050 [Oryza sativa Japonica Group]|jgi:hypothetical protein|uniref:Os07g0192050 protein n=1 Tax=Oryza sativa subsp. japonica TaxID=39947 RepID=A0A0P0X3B4_ORYSJ|nr:Os07g0192050 [Oryza sativa Japonica Group]